MARLMQSIGSCLLACQEACLGRNLGGQTRTKCRQEPVWLGCTHISREEPGSAVSSTGTAGACVATQLKTNWQERVWPASGSAWAGACVASQRLSSGRSLYGQTKAVCWQEPLWPASRNVLAGACVASQKHSIGRSLCGQPTASYTMQCATRVCNGLSQPTALVHRFALGMMHQCCVCTCRFASCQVHLAGYAACTHCR